MESKLILDELQKMIENLENVWILINYNIILAFLYILHYRNAVH
jgi:hypothetical protein